MGPAAELVHRLIDVGLLSTRDVVDGDVTVVDLSRSNAVRLVDAGAGRRYVAKVVGAQHGDLQGSGAVETMLYERVSCDPVLSAGAPLPALVGRFGDLLVLAFAGEGEGLAQRLRDRGPSAGDGRLLGDALGQWRAVGDALPGGELPGRLPWVFRALEDDRPAFVDEHPAMRRLGQLLRDAPALRAAVGKAARSWRREAVIHGDVRWDNVVVTLDPRTDRERLLLIDLEFADVGDPAWDVAGALAEPLAVAAVADAGDGAADGVLAPTDRRTAGRYVRDLRPFLGCFIAAYREAAGPVTVDGDLGRAVRLVPARLVQAAFQHAAWIPTSGVAAGLAAAGLAATLMASPELLGGTLREPVARFRGANALVSGRSP